MDAVSIITEPRRREILRLVWDQERSASEIASQFTISFGAVSQHLGVLRRAGLVLVRPDGTRRFYRANRQALQPFSVLLEQMWTNQLDRLPAPREAARAQPPDTSPPGPSPPRGAGCSGRGWRPSSTRARAACSA